MLSKLSKPPDGPIIVAADSVEEALAFLSQLLGERGGDELAAFRDRVLVFGDRGVLPRLSQSVRNFIPVVFTRDVERELAPFTMSMHCIVVYPGMRRTSSQTSYSGLWIMRHFARHLKK